MKLVLQKKEEALPGISVMELPKGRLAKIVMWDCVPDAARYVDKIVQRCGDEGQHLGEVCGDLWWPGFFSEGAYSARTYPERHRVELLPLGAVFILEEED